VKLPTIPPLVQWLLLLLVAVLLLQVVRASAAESPYNGF
jgi:hypothetical protein